MARSTSSGWMRLRHASKSAAISCVLVAELPLPLRRVVDRGRRRGSIPRGRRCRRGPRARAAPATRAAPPSPRARSASRRLTSMAKPTSIASSSMRRTSSSSNHAASGEPQHQHAADRLARPAAGSTPRRGSRRPRRAPRAAGSRRGGRRRRSTPLAMIGCPSAHRPGRRRWWRRPGPPRPAQRLGRGPDPPRRRRRSRAADRRRPRARSRRRRSRPARRRSGRCGSNSTDRFRSRTMAWLMRLRTS